MGHRAKSRGPGKLSGLPISGSLAAAQLISFLAAPSAAAKAKGGRRKGITLKNAEVLIWAAGAYSKVVSGGRWKSCWVATAYTVPLI